MATRTETDIKLYTDEELQDIQNNSHSGSATDSKGNIQAVLSAIVTYTKAAAEANRNYVDILWSSIKTGNYTAKILGWIDMKPERSLDEHKYGVADTIWMVDIGSRITESGCEWIFVYNRDSEEPAGLRISWWKESDNDKTNPIDEAWSNNPYIILPKNKYAFPTATEVNTVVVQPNAMQVNKDFINNIFSTINYHIQTAAKGGNNNVRIPWETFGSSAEVQQMFVLTSKDITLVDVQDLSALSGCFNYGKLSNGHYTETKNRPFTIDDFDPLEMGFFNDATYLEDNYTPFKPATSFTLYQILTEVLGYGVSYSAGVNPANGQAFCMGLLIVWDKENSSSTNTTNANYFADDAYNNELQQYTDSLTSVLSWPEGTVPTLDHYIAANRKNNTAWLKTFVDLTTSKMNAAFAKGDRAIHILWSEVSSSYADEVKRAWQNGACEYDGYIKAAVPTGSDLGKGAQTSLSSAFNQIMNAGYYYAGSSNPPVYSYGYIRYKKSGDTGSGGGSNSATIEDISHNESIGLALTLYGYVASSPQSGSTGDAQTADAIRGIQLTWKAKEAPKTN